MRFALISGGTFTMGSPDSEQGRKEDEGPQHQVKISPFWMGKPLDAVILLLVSDEEATKRLRARAEKEGRADDSPEAIRNRLRLYHDLTERVVDRYQTAGIEVIVDGEQTMDDVFADVQDALEGVLAGR